MKSGQGARKCAGGVREERFPVQVEPNGERRRWRKGKKAKKIGRRTETVLPERRTARLIRHAPQARPRRHAVRPRHARPARRGSPWRRAVAFRLPERLARSPRSRHRAPWFCLRQLRLVAPPAPQQEGPRANHATHKSTTDGRQQRAARLVAKTLSTFQQSPPQKKTPKKGT